MPGADRRRVEVAADLGHEPLDEGQVLAVGDEDESPVDRQRATGQSLAGPRVGEQPVAQALRGQGPAA